MQCAVVGLDEVERPVRERLRVALVVRPRARAPVLARVRAGRRVRAEVQAARVQVRRQRGEPAAAGARRERLRVGLQAARGVARLVGPAVVEEQCFIPQAI